MNNPIAYMYQHDETGRIGFVDPQQIGWGFEKANPRLHIVAPLYRNKWVPIEDSLPPDETPVLVMFRGQRRIAELRWLEPGREDDWGAALMSIDLLYAAVERTKRGIGIPLISAVIDTYDSRRFVRDYIGTRLKDKVINSGGTYCFRPDSGDPTIEPGLVGLDIEATFGVDINANGYKKLKPYTAVIQGDGNRIDTYRGVIQGWVDAGFSMDNFTLGMGSGITHDNARDDFSFSMKAIANLAGDKWERLSKDPITDPGKKSLSGLVRCREDAEGTLVVYDALLNGDMYTFETETPGWKCWFRDGYRGYHQSFDSVRERANEGV